MHIDGELAQLGSYTFAEVSRLLHVSVSSLRYWLYGRDHGDGRQYGPLIGDGTPRESGPISFEELAQLAVIASLKLHGVRVQNLRPALDYIRDSGLSDRPLFRDLLFDRDQQEIFIQQEAMLISASKQGQGALRPVLQDSLDRLEVEDGVISGVRLFSRPHAPTTDPAAVAVRPRVRFGRPHTVAHNLETAVVYARFGAGESLSQIADDYEVPLDEVEEALRFEQSVAA